VVPVVLNFLKKHLKLFSIVLLWAVALAGCSNFTTGTALPQTGSSAPDFVLQTLDGQKVMLSKLQGKPVLLNFWATWCPPCKAEMPYLQQIYDQYSRKGLVMYEIDIGESDATVRQFMNDNHLTLPVLLDTDKKVNDLYRIAGIPTTFLIDKNGIIRGRILGGFQDKVSIEKELAKIYP
jgi:thiol-disulfide isomerase/thioredoxin